MISIMADMNQLSGSDPIYITGQKLQTRGFPQVFITTLNFASDKAERRLKINRRFFLTLVHGSSRNVLVEVGFVRHSQRHCKLKK
uniref:Uncharacterized protein n=1 Tax=Anguilla anguilla TaxID=7936 RepID=A0A0E9TE66_ANGAN